jgi:acyl-CoA reductase-like NAD-dependent aldehyde dehydrogenase
MLSTTKVARKEIARGQLLINGQWRDSETGETMPTTDPTIEAVITQVAKATSADADAAVKAAHRAFENGPWRRMHHEQRAKILFKMADLMDERAEDFAIGRRTGLIAQVLLGAAL